MQYITLFLISGLGHIFWVLPMVRKWGRFWDIIGISGTAVLAGLTGYVVIESLRNPQLTPPGITELAVVTVIIQISYVITTEMILVTRK